jgi:hypothetical protein
MRGVAPHMRRSSSPSIVRRRSLGSLPRFLLHRVSFSIAVNDGFLLPKRTVMRSGGNGDQLVRLADGGLLVDDDRHRQHDLLFAGYTPRRIA